MFEALKDKELLEEVLEALDAKKIKGSDQVVAKDKEAGSGQNEVGTEDVMKETKKVELEAIFEKSSY